MTTRTSPGTSAETAPASPEALRTRIVDLLTASRARSTALTDAVDEIRVVRPAKLRAR